MSTRAAIFTVTSAADSGGGSLRFAIEAANFSSGLDTIVFTIPGGGPHTIDVASPLPIVVDPVIIDGTTQPGFSASTGHPRIVLNGTNAGVGVDGLVLRGGGHTVRALCINRFDNNGIFIGVEPGSKIEGNYIGTNSSGTVSQPNGGTGVIVIDSSSNTIGGNTTAARNVISGNNVGIAFLAVDGTSAGNIVRGNHIGINAAGTAALGNTSHGVVVAGGPNTTIGGTTAAARNVISGNGENGVLISGPGSGGVVVQGNYIGTNAAGSVALGNGGSGLNFANAPANTIGGTVAGARNVISGNGDDGMVFFDSAGNAIQGNYIGLNAVGTAALANADSGISLSNSPNTTIGGTTAGARNVISGNGQAGTASGQGITISGVSGGDNLIQGNYIGIDAGGTSPLGNFGDGIVIAEAADNVIGGAAAGAGNVISGNGDDGIQIFLGAGDTLVQGNLIGTNAAGTAGLGNVDDGVSVGSGSNTIGGTAAGARNVISGNGDAGILLESPTTGNVVEGNYIGANAAGTGPVSNIGSGIFILQSDANTIGGTTAAARNVISANGDDGIAISSADDNVIQGNYIGPDVNGDPIGVFNNAPVGNILGGIFIANGSSNIIGGAAPGAGNVIAFNGDQGVIVAGTALGNPISVNSIHSNGSIGIDLGFNGFSPNDADDPDSGPNNLQNFPVLSSAGYDSGSNTATFSYRVPSSGGSSAYPLRVEFFLADGGGEGRTFLGSDTFTSGDFSSGLQRTTVTSPDSPLAINDLIVATATDANGNTSEFSIPVTVGSQSPPLALSGFLPASGLAGSSVTVFGANFTGTTSVTINGAAASFVVEADGLLLVTVPAGASSGPIAVTTGSGTTTSNTSFTVLADNDGDGMSNDFEQLYFGSITGGNPALDSDKDGRTNLEEFQAGTNPTDPNSVLRISEVRRKGSSLVLVFEAKAGKRYRVKAGASLSGGFPTLLGAILPSETDRIWEVTENDVASDPVRFYIVELVD
ncbi:MAG: hypothetical protein AAGI48_03125 [Verrucomicrobiota bacterium]